MKPSAGLVVTLLLGVAFLAGGATRHPSAWGVHAWGFLPGGAAALALFVWATLLLPGAAQRLGAWTLTATAAIQRRTALVLVVAVLAGLLFWLLRLRFQFLGDGQLWVDLIEQGTAVHHFEPLAGILVAGLARVVDAEAPAPAAGTLSIAAGVVFVVVAAALGRTLWRDAAAAALTWFLLVWNPVALLWFGYVESYPLVLLLQVLLAWALVQCTRGNIWVWVAAAIMVVANASHVLTFTWWPSLWVLVWWRSRSVSWPHRVLRASGLSVAMLVAVVALWWACGVSPSGIFERLGSERGLESLSAGWFWSRAHLLDLVNVCVLLLAPALVLALGSLGHGARAGAFVRTPEGSILLSLLVGPVLVVLLVPPLIGGARDWDLHATLVLPVTLWAVDLWQQTRVPQAGTRRRTPRAQPERILAGRVVGLAVLATLAWVAVPLDSDRGARHLEVLQEPRGTFGTLARAHANEALGIFHRTRSAVDEHAAWQRATEVDPYNPRYHINRANAALKLERVEEAQRHFARALERGFDEWHVYYNLGVCGMQLGDMAEAERRFTELIEAYPQEWRGWGGRGEARLSLERPAAAAADLQRAAELQPQDVRVHQLLGRALWGLGDRTAARAAWQRALALDPGNALTRELLAQPH